jgi:Ca2+-transporting ATPase
VFFADWPLLLLPVHIVFLELIINPACALVFEAEAAEPNVMHRPPRSPEARLFSRQMVGIAILQGLSALTVCLALFVSTRGTHGANASRALVFVSLVVSVIVIILMNRSWTRTAVHMFREPNATVWWVVGGASAFLAIVLFLPAIRSLFQFAPLHGLDILLSLLAGAACLVWFDLLKLTPWWRQRQLVRA